MEQTEQIMQSMRRRGIELRVENGQLRYQARSGALLPEDLATLRELKSEIIKRLQRVHVAASNAEPPLVRRSWSDVVPLTFSQQWMWNRHRSLGQTRSARECSFAVHLQGALNLDSLRRSVAVVFERHEALRTRIVMKNAIPRQEVHEAAEYGLEIVPVTAMPTASVQDVARRIVGEILSEPVAVLDGPLCGIYLLRLSDTDAVLVGAMHHLIADAFSVRILMRDILATYTLSSRGLLKALPELRVQYPDYAVWQERSQQVWTDRHGTYWSDRLRDAARVKLPRDHPSAKATFTASEQVPIGFGTSLSARFRELSRQSRTPLAICVLAAYVATILRCCQSSELVSGFIALGRNRPEFQHLIGFFSHILYLRIELFDDDTFVTFLERAGREYFAACQHQDLGRHAAMLPLYARNTNFNWISSHDRSARAGWPGLYSNDGIAVKQFDYSKAGARSEWEDSDGILDTEPWVMLKDTAEGIGGTLRYRRQFFEPPTMERFASQFCDLAAAFAQNPYERMKAVWNMA